jgi:UDP-3-O-[3-hydroxymyristoyl] N-acetylglucosamine deacetylase
MQHTLRNKVTIRGTGLHSGAAVTMTLNPAPAGQGILFIRTDVKGLNNEIPALWDRVVDTRLCTVIGNGDGVTIGTIEHLMAALRGCGIDNVTIMLDAPEVPVMDGSAAPFVEKIDLAGVREQWRPRRAIKILEDVRIADGDKYVHLSPSHEAVFAGEIDFSHPSIGFQKREVRLLNGNFRHDLADSRTFGFFHEVEMLRQNGLARGGSLENAIVLDQEKIMNPDGLRHDDEFIRHKLLDAVGDLYLAGGPILGAYEGRKAGHALNNAILRKLFATREAWRFVDLDEETGNAGMDYMLPIAARETVTA